MARTSNHPPVLERQFELTERDELPPLDPLAIQRNYRRERVRRHLRTVRHHDSRSSDARFFVALAVVVFVTIVIALAALSEIHQLFGI